MLAIASILKEARLGRGEDRLAVVGGVGLQCIVVADGAGGMARGSEAAESVCHALAAETDWARWLERQDAALAARNTGQTAVVCLSITGDGRISGASVGDCAAWLFGRDTHEHLTESQVRKPLLGDGAAQAAAFEGRLAGRTLVVATDGLWKYMALSRIAIAAAIRPLEAALFALIDGVRLPNGTLQDDVAIVLCEEA